MHIRQVQLDELYAVLSAVKDGQTSEEEAIQRLSRAPHWVWTALDPQSKLLLVITVGPRTRAMAQRVVHQVMEVLASGYIPLFVTDGFKEYMSALLRHFGSWVQPERRQAKGPVPKPRWMLHGSLCQPLPQPVPTNGTGSAKQRRPCTPAIAAGLTDHVRSLKEVLMCRVPPWPQPQMV